MNTVKIVLLLPLLGLMLSTLPLHAQSVSADAMNKKCPEGMVYARLYYPKSGDIEHFCIDKYEYPATYPGGPGKEAMRNVSWYMASKLCQKRGKRLCKNKEWLEACRGCRAKGPYPYGSTYDPMSCNSEGKGVLPAGSKEKCQSNYGVYDMAGNLAEWCEDWYDVYRSPHRSPTEGTLRIIRGGSWYKGAGSIQAWRRDFARPYSIGDDSGADRTIGFRTVTSIP